ncbi:MAG TPA: lysophospholipid acyltransferase family protein [Thermoanaerobaculia bacterium]|nr:lysophospholipid acyltransferase family protein [Thermoanaerobaculia bacterium]
MKLVSFLAALVIRTLHATLRVEHVRAENVERTPQYILAFWHAHLLLMLHSRYRKPISALISQSKDGEYIARVFDWYGVDSARGSSTRGGGAALRELLREARSGKNLAFTPDGPKGPARIAKDGVVYAAKMSGLPIVPVAFAAKKKSSSAPGTGWSCRIRSRKRSSFTASRCSCRATATSRNGG